MHPSAAPRTSPAAWDELRLAFHRSLLVDTRLSSLAQNIDGCVWPLEDAEEKPSSYIDLDHAEVLSRLRSLGLPEARLDDLAAILRGTLAFDQSFGEMVAVASRAEAAADPVSRNLKALGIPADLPLALCEFTPGMRDFCARERLLTLGEFLAFSRGASRQVVIGGEFRDLLNAVVHIDEATLARHLPFRPKTSGVYLVESLALLLRPLPIEARMTLARHPETCPPELGSEIARRIDYFSDQARALRALMAEGRPLSRVVVQLDDLSLEAAVAALLGVFLRPETKPVAKPAKCPARPSLLRRLLGRGAPSPDPASP